MSIQVIMRSTIEYLLTCRLIVDGEAAPALGSRNFLLPSTSVATCRAKRHLQNEGKSRSRLRQRSRLLVKLVSGAIIFAFDTRPERA